ncbi:MAG: cytochrome c biogenesis protein ResB [Candidatus Dormibacteria bacterium]
MTRRRGEGIPGAVRHHLNREWRTLARMKSAVILLAIVAGFSIIATLLPQRALQPQKASDFIQAHQVAGPIYDNLGLFSVYESWFFLVPLVLMYVSLGNCVITRSRALYRRWRKGLPRGPQFIGEAGSLVFHVSFFVLLFGVMFNLAAGFTAYVNIIEGDSVVDARSSYDQIEEGALFSPQQHKGFEVKVDSFHATYYDSGKPRDFVTHATVIDGGRVIKAQDIRVNQYLAYKDIKFYQASYGWAPVLQVFDPSGRTVFDAPVVFFGDPNFAHGVLKVPAAGPPGQQLGARMFFAPDLRDTGNAATAGSANLRNPGISFAFFKGDLHANRTANVYDIDVSAMQQVWTGGLLVGQSADLPGGYRVAFPRVMQYTTLQVTDAPGLPVIWASFVLMLGGLMVRLYLRPLMEWRGSRAGAPAPSTAGGVATGTAGGPKASPSPMPPGPVPSAARNPTG